MNMFDGYECECECDQCVPYLVADECCDEYEAAEWDFMEGEDRE